MKKSKINVPIVILMVIIGVRVVKDFDFQTLTFKKPFLDGLYLTTLIGFLVFIYWENIIKNKKRDI